MGIDENFPIAFAKAQIAAGSVLPTKGSAVISVRHADKQAILPIAKSLVACGFSLLATGGTYAALKRAGIPAKHIPKLGEERPNLADFIKNGQVQLIINTPTRKGPTTDEGKIRALAVMNRVPIVTTITGAVAASRAIESLQKLGWNVRPLQDFATPRR
jgi:carbamoyl-phosphate synthase large subunit